MDLPRHILNRIEQLERAVLTLVQRVEVQQVDDNTPIQTVQVSALGQEILAKLERIQPLGLASLPSVNSAPDGVVVFVGGDRSHGILLSMEEQGKRPALAAAGDVALYSPGAASLQLLLSTGLQAVEILAPQVNIRDKDTPLAGQVTIDGDLTVNGNLILPTGDITAAAGTITGLTVQDSIGALAVMRSAYNVHTHSETGGTTSGPSPTA